MVTLKERQSVQLRDLGLIDYAQAYSLQKECVAGLLDGGPQTLLVCEHPSVLTLGRLASENNILFSREELLKKGIEVIPIDRGGEVTLHSPGQIVVYPILDLKNYRKDLKFYIYKLEQVAIDFLKGFGILACRSKEGTGVWVKQKKIASIGIGVRKWVTFHGLSVNVNTDLGLFSLIKPCGLDVEMTSVSEIKRQQINIALAKERLVKSFEKNFEF